MKMHGFVGKHRLIAVLFAVFALAGCSSTEFVSPIPSGYKGPTAKITDSYSHNSGSSAYFFVVKAIDGLPIEDSGHRTEKELGGRTTRMSPQIAARWVRAEEQTFTIAGFVQHASKTQGMFGDKMEVGGEVTFTPEPNGRYVVKGKLSESGSSVWIQDVRGRVVTEKIVFTPPEETASR